MPFSACLYWPVHFLCKCKMCIRDRGENIRIQYGGSMNAGNVDGLMAMPDIDGGLIGGASLKAPDFLRIVNYKG